MNTLLDDVKGGDWLAFVSTTKVADPVIQKVISVTAGLVKTQNYTFRKDRRAFHNHYKSLTARRATSTEIEAWLSRRWKQQTKSQSSDDEPPEVVLARYLASVSVKEWARLGVAQLKKIKDALEKSRGE